MTYLAINKHKGHIGLKDIASHCDIPLRFLELVFSKLKGAQIVSSVRGAGGGYNLNRNPSKINLAEIIYACEGKTGISLPGNVTHRVRQNDIVGKAFIQRINDELSRVDENLCKITLAELIQSSGLSSEMYWI